jgi:hypothetical protein
MNRAQAVARRVPDEAQPTRANGPGESVSEGDSFA